MDGVSEHVFVERIVFLTKLLVGTTVGSTIG